MRKALLALVGVATVALTAAAPLQAQFGFGPIVGLSIANIRGADKDNLAPGRTSRTGFVVGAVFDIPVGGIVSIRPEFLYVQKGAKFEELGAKATIKADYVEIPALIVVAVPVSGSVVPEFFAGPQVSFQVNCKVSGNLPTLPTVSTSCSDAGIDLTSTVWGLIFGAGVQVAGFVGSVQYDLGLTTLDAATDPLDIKDSTFMIKVGYLFHTR